MEETKQEIDLINTIIQRAIIHGGKPGGEQYSSIDTLNLKISIFEWLLYKHLNKDYKVKKVSILSGPECIQIVENVEKE